MLNAVLRSISLIMVGGQDQDDAQVAGRPHHSNGLCEDVRHLETLQKMITRIENVHVRQWSCQGHIIMCKVEWIK